jgi:hypothetical protein
VVPWVEVTHVRKHSASVTISRRSGGRIRVPLGDKAVRELVLRQIAARAIPTA